MATFATFPVSQKLQKLYEICLNAVKHHEFGKFLQLLQLLQLSGKDFPREINRAQVLTPACKLPSHRISIQKLAKVAKVAWNLPKCCKTQWIWKSWQLLQLWQLSGKDFPREIHRAQVLTPACKLPRHRISIQKLPKCSKSVQMLEILSRDLEFHESHHTTPNP